MRSAVVAVLLLVAYCEARPSFNFDARPIFGSSYIVGGVEADVGEFPWQLSQQRGNGASWSHSCGASLLTGRYALSAAHCVDGASPSALRVVAGLHDRNGRNGAASLVKGYKTHEQYGQRSVTFSDDIAIITLESEIAVGENIQYAKLPADNKDLFVGQSGVISGWGRTSSSNALPQFLQKANIGVIGKDRCNEILSTVQGANVDDTQICLYDEENKRGSCNGDSGGPFNINGVVGGVTSWGISNWFTGCFQTYPSVYTRTSAYLDWIAANTQ